MFNHKNTPSYFLKKTQVPTSNSDIPTSKHNGDVTQDIRDTWSSPPVREPGPGVSKHLQPPTVTTDTNLRVPSSSSLSPRDSRDKNTEKTSEYISATVGEGGIPRDAEVGDQVTSQVPIQIKQDKKSASPPTSSEVTEEMKIDPKNTYFDSGQEYKSVTVSSHWSWDDIFHTVNTTNEEEFSAMTEELWQHALAFLDRHGPRAGEHRAELYEFADKTGILERHKQLLARPGHETQGDMKIMYYELIKMLIAYEQNPDAMRKGEHSPDRRELSDKLQSYLNQRFLEDVETLKKRTATTITTKEVLRSGEVNQEISLEKLREQIQAHDDAMDHLDDLQTYLQNNHQECSLKETLGNILQLNSDNKKLIKQIEIKSRTSGEKEGGINAGSDDFINSLQKQISILQSGFEDLKSKIVNVCSTKEKSDMNSNVTQADRKGEPNKSEKLSKQYLPDVNNIIKSFQECREKLTNLETNFENVKQDAGNFNDKNMNIENKMLRIIDQINTLMIKMVQVEEKTKTLEYKGKDFECKLSSLESADVYLQEADRMIIEKMSKLEGDLGRSDIRTYIDNNLLQVSKKLHQKYSEVKEQLVQQELNFEKEKNILEVKIERLSNETNDHKKVENTLSKNSASNCNGNSDLATTNNNNMNLNDAFINGTTNNNYSAIIANNETSMVVNQDQVWTALSELYSAFRGSTVLVRSQGALSEQMPDVLGVFRLVDSHGDKPLYKQDAGENYIYFCHVHGTWYIGTVVGHQLAWVRNCSPGARGARWPGELGGGWEWRHGYSPDSWATDHTLRVQALPDVERIRDMLNKKRPAIINKS